MNEHKELSYCLAKFSSPESLYLSLIGAVLLRLFTSVSDWIKQVAEVKHSDLRGVNAAPLCRSKFNREKKCYAFSDANNFKLSHLIFTGVAHSMQTIDV